MLLILSTQHESLKLHFVEQFHGAANHYENQEEKFLGTLHGMMEHVESHFISSLLRNSSPQATLSQFFGQNLVATRLNLGLDKSNPSLSKDKTRVMHHNPKAINL